MLLGPTSARLSIVEGRYHQVKRMFGHFDNKVLRLHRESMGPLVLDNALKPGEYRAFAHRRDPIDLSVYRSAEVVEQFTNGTCAMPSPLLESGRQPKCD